MRKFYLKRLMLLMLLSVGMLSSLLAATIVVTNINDSGEGSLRQAVLDAASGDVITFDVSTNNQNLLLTSGEIVIDKDLKIEGNGRTRTNLSGNQTNRIFNVTDGARVVLVSMRLQNGRTNMSGGALQNVDGTVFLRNVIVRSSIATGSGMGMGGGGIHNRGTMFLRECTINGNTATGSNDGSDQGMGSGGGILNAGEGALELVLCSVTNNVADRAGGGIEDASGSESLLYVRLSMIDGNVVNTSPGNGGGIHVGGGPSFIDGGTVSNNSAGAEGGGLWNGGGRMRVDDVIVDNNTALGDDATAGGGGIYNDGGILLVDLETQVTNNDATGTSGSGGGIHNALGGQLIVREAIITGNTAQRAGGGIEDASGSTSTVGIRGSTIDNNTVASNPGNGGGIHVGGDGNLTIRNSSLNGNSAGGEGGGAWNAAGTMRLRNVTVNNNVVTGGALGQGGGGLYNLSGTMILTVGCEVTDNDALGETASGGGIYNSTGASLIVLGATIDGNETNRAGGGIEDASGAGSTFLVSGVSISNNSAAANPGNGGGIHVGGDGSVSLANLQVNDNTAAAEGGGLWVGSGSLTIRNSTVDGNTAAGDDADQGGGGIYSDVGGSVLVNRDVTISNNSATGTSGSGGGIFNGPDSKLTVRTNVTITGNQANRAGGGIEDASGSSTLVDLRGLTLSNNSVNTVDANPGNGGGLHVTGDGEVRYIGGIVSDNEAALEGGGLWSGTGKLSVNDVDFTNNVAAGDGAANGGGAIFNISGVVNINDAIFLENDATGDAGSGGAILSLDGDVRVIGSTFTENSAVRAGGAVELVIGSFESIDTDYDDNIGGSAPGRGGAFHITGDMGATPSTVSFTGGEFRSNSAANQGGAIWNQSGVSMSITSAEFVNNAIPSASADIIERIAGGAIYNNGGTLDITSSTFEGNNLQSAAGNVTAGGAIANDDGGIMTLTTSTLASNSASIGGGIANAATLTISNSTITNNNAGRAGGIAQSVVLVSATGGGAVLNIGGTILAGNTSGANPNFEQDGGTTTSTGYNLIGQDPNGEFPLAATDVKVTQTRLEALRDNGGSVRTIRPRCPTGGNPGSPAINGGDPDDFSVDQLGNPVFGGRRDIGAFERQTACPSGVVGGPSSDLNGSSADLALSEQTFGVYPNPARTGILNVTLPEALGDDITVKVFDASGRMQEMVRTAANGSYTMDISSLRPGTYGLQVVSGDQVEHTLFVVAQ